MSQWLDKFHKYLAKTTPFSLSLEISRAQGSYIFDLSGKSYLDFVSGVSACNLGHSHPEIIRAIKQQLDRFCHVMVYGELVQESVIDYAEKLLSHLPTNHEVLYPTNSGTEAIEGAIKLAKKATGRFEIIAARNCYHGSTQGSLSLLSNPKQINPFRPLIPGVKHITYNNVEDLNSISEKTAAVVLETIQGGAGFIVPKMNYLRTVKDICHQNGAILILDEIQSGFGRTGTLFGFQQENVSPDILVIGKAMGSGLPVGGFTASHSLMDLLATNPTLGHITTFGGNPVSMAASLATLLLIEQLLSKPYINQKERLFREILIHPKIIEIRGRGLMLALILSSNRVAKELIKRCVKKGLILFGLLWKENAVRVTPALNISLEEITTGCQIILEVLDEI